MANRSPFPLEGGYMPCFHRGSHRRELNPPPTPVVAKKVTRGLHCGSSRVATFSLLNTISTKRTRKLFEKLLSDVAHQKVLPPHLPEQIYRSHHQQQNPLPKLTITPHLVTPLCACSAQSRNLRGSASRACQCSAAGCFPDHTRALSL